MKKLLAILLLCASPAFAQFANSDVSLQTMTSSSTGFGYDWQQFNSRYEMTAPNDSYHDNVLVLENDSYSTSMSQHGGTAIRYRDWNTKCEYGASGADLQNAGGFYFVFMEFGNLCAAQPSQDTDFQLQLTHASTATHLPSTMYWPFQIHANTGDILFNSSTGVTDNMINRLYMTAANGDFVINGQGNTDTGYQLGVLSSHYAIGALGTTPIISADATGGAPTLRANSLTATGYQPAYLEMTRTNAGGATPNATTIGRVLFDGTDSVGAYDIFASIDVNIGTNQAGGASSYMVLGAALPGANSTGQVWIWPEATGINTSAPVATLDVNGTFHLKKYSSQPYACVSGADGTLALTHVYTTCICNGSAWVSANDGVIACVW